MTVHRRARLHMLVTGSELLPLGAPPEPGKIHESNGLMVRLLAERAGAQVIDHGVIADDFESTRAAVEAGPGRGRAGRLRRRLRRAPRPRQARVRGVRRRGGVLARAREARQAAVVRPPWLDARVRPPGQPALEHRRLPRLHRARAAPPARRARPCHAHGARPPDRGRRPVRRPHHVPHLAPRPGADGVLEATPTADQGSHLTGALGQSDGFAIAPHGSGPLPAGAWSTQCGLSSWRESDFRERDRKNPRRWIGRGIGAGRSCRC